MTCKSSTDPNDVGPLSQLVLRYGAIMKRIIDNESKQPGFTSEGWAELTAMVNTEEFERVGNFLDVGTWADYLHMLTEWARNSGWDYTFKRITEVDRRVIQELEERGTHGERRSKINSVSIFEFDDHDKIRHLDIYLQSKPAEVQPVV